MNLNTSIAVVLAAVALAIGVAMSGGDTYVTSEGQGGIGVPGVALYPQSVTTFTEGGGVFTHATSGTAYTLPATAIDTENYVAITPTGGNLTVTLPATSSFPGIQMQGIHERYGSRTQQPQQRPQQSQQEPVWIYRNLMARTLLSGRTITHDFHVFVCLVQT